MHHRSGGPPTPRAGATRRRRRGIAAAGVLALTCGLLTACGSSGKPTLNWYINPDGVDTLNALAERCSTDDYDIETQLLPTGATDQRIQLARRLAAEDTTTDLMNLDPVFVAEFANAGWIEEFPEEAAATAIEEDVLAGIADTVQWDGGVYASPLWANTQLLWYRKSLAEAAGLDMSQPVTWAQIIDAAADNGGTVGVQADRYEAYVVLINSLVQGAGGDIIDPETAEQGKDATVDIDSEAGRAAATVIQKLAQSDAAQNDLSVSREGTSLPAMFEGSGEFMTNWTFVYKNYEPGDANDFTDEQFADLGYTRYPQTVEGEESRPPVGGIDVAVGAYTENKDWALEAAQCVTDGEAQVQLAVESGLMPARSSAYDDPALKEAYPEDLLALYRESIDSGAPRPKSAYYSTISSAIQSVWHSPTQVDPETTPRESAEFLQAVLEGKALL